MSKQKPAVTTRKDARARAAEKMAERKERERKVAEQLEEYFAAAGSIEKAEAARDDAIAKAQSECAQATKNARTQQATHVLDLKSLGLTDKEIAELTEQSLNAIRELVKSARPDKTTDRNAGKAARDARTDERDQSAGNTPDNGTETAGGGDRVPVAS